jgi:hypothetical protein
VGVFAAGGSRRIHSEDERIIDMATERAIADEGKDVLELQWRAERLDEVLSRGRQAGNGSGELDMVPSERRRISIIIIIIITSIALSMPMWLTITIIIIISTALSM